MKFRFLTAMVLGMMTSACAQAQLLDGKTLQELQWPVLTDQIRDGDVVFLGEIHDDEVHHGNQRSVVEALKARGFEVSIGMEFFEKRFQPEVDRWVKGELSEADFLKAIKWGKMPFEFYRETLLSATSTGGSVVALNASRELTGKISKVGLAGLSDEERKQLPEGFALGNANYYSRFEKTMAEHVKKEQIQRYFEAQSVWDDTMASSVKAAFSKRLLSANGRPQVFVVIVGDFHVAFSGGTPDRLRNRGLSQIRVISQLKNTGWSSDELAEELGPDPKAGIRSEWIFIH